MCLVYQVKTSCFFSTHHYIDPPYNTGNEKWAYNDNVNSPEIRKWLGEAVGKEGETLDSDPSQNNGQYFPLKIT